MTSKVSSAIDELENGGPMPLAKKSALYLLRQTSFGKSLLYDRTLEELRKRMGDEDGLDDILDTVLGVKPGYPPYQIAMMQLRDEIEELASIIKEEQPKSVLEIGTANGGTLYVWSRYLDSTQQLISLDLPDGQFGGGYGERKAEIFREFSPSKEFHFVRDNSHRSGVYEQVDNIADDGLDFLFLDGDHSYQGVKQDFEMYSQLVNDGGIVALHDIVNHPDREAVIEQRRRTVDDIEERHLSWGVSHPDCNVDEFWAELSRNYDTEEIISHPKQTWGGIGIVRM
ncbi:class I SAM-dependent methyltransferase [Halomicrobium sp. HM KBTZ05]|uniref:class I SAM-dependent methyltransferase n=1 Tax=Halomicrobium sp. HM KBTZ05 TaxID=3242663 RepID=UPI0035577C4E